MTSDFELSCKYFYQACSEDDEEQVQAWLDVLFGQHSPFPALSNVVAAEILYEGSNRTMCTPNAALFRQLMLRRCGVVTRLAVTDPELVKFCRPVYRPFFRHAGQLGALPMLDVLVGLVQQDFATAVRQQADVSRANTVIRGCYSAALTGAVEFDHPEVLNWLTAIPSAAVVPSLELLRCVFYKGSRRFMEALLQLFPDKAVDVVNIGCNIFYSACVTLNVAVVKRMLGMFLPMTVFQDRVATVVGRAKLSVTVMMNIPVDEDPAFREVLLLLEEAYPAVAVHS